MLATTALVAALAAAHAGNAVLAADPAATLLVRCVRPAQTPP
eukprot:COSAG06_NODE_52494_length_305_cov_0.786408_1_plen_41_part_01